MQANPFLDFDMIQRRSYKLYKQENLIGREQLVYFCEIQSLLMDGTKLSQRGALAYKEVLMQVGAFLLLLASLAPLSFRRA